MLCMTKKNSNMRSKRQIESLKNQTESSVSDGVSRSLKIVMIAVCVISLACLLYFCLLGWNLYHDKSLSAVYGLVMGLGFLAALGVSSFLFYRYKVQKRASKRIVVRFNFTLLASWVLFIATFFSYLSSAVYGPGFSNIVTLALAVIAAPLAVIVLSRASKIGSLVFGVMALLIMTLEVTMIASTNAMGDGVWTVGLPSWFGLAANVFAAAILFGRLRRK